MEKIVIDGGITITVVETRPNWVRLGIDAPRELAVHRLEVAKQIAKSKRREEGQP